MARSVPSRGAGRFTPRVGGGSAFFVRRLVRLKITMFIISLHYIKDLSEVDRFVAEHRLFLERQFAAGKFLMSGRKEPRTGGVIIAHGYSLAEIEAIIQADPFHREQIARYEITQFTSTMTARVLNDYKAA